MIAVSKYPATRARTWTLRVVAIVITTALGACAEDSAAPPEGGDVAGGDLDLLEIGLQVGASVQIEVGLQAVSCVTFTSCNPDLVTNPFTQERDWTLTTGLACRADRVNESQEPLDPFLSLRRRMTCYEAGDPGDRGSWSPAEGHEIRPFREQVFARLTSPYADAEFHLATLLIDASKYALCEYEAWGIFDSPPAGTTERTATYAERAPVAHWSVVISPAAGGAAYDCHLEDGGVSEVSLSFSVGVALGTPDDPNPGRFPVVRDVAALLPAQYLWTTSEGAREISGVHLVYTPTAAFPVDEWADPGSFETRDLIFEHPLDGGAADAAIFESCAVFDGDGDIEAIGGVLLSRDDDGLLGGVLVWRDPYGGFDCERDPEGRLCRVRPLDEAAELVGCLR